MRKRGKLGSLWVSFSVSNGALANFTGGLPATVIGSPGRDRICRRNWISLPGVETPSRKLDGKFPYSATQLFPPKKFRGMSRRRSVRCSAPRSSMFVKHPLEKNTLASAVADFGNEVEHDVAFGSANAREVHAGKRAQVLPRDRPRPPSLDGVQPVHSIQEESALQPSRGYSPGEAAVQRMNRQLSTEVTTTATQVVMNV